MTFDVSKKFFLVTGATGQVGSFLVEKLVKEKANVIALGRNKKNLKELKHLVDDGKVKFIECDLTDEKRIKSIGPLLENVDFLAHLSSEYRFPLPNSLSSAFHTVELDLKGTTYLLRELKKLQGILFTSSIAVYGNPSHLPVDESCPINPNYFYGSGKFGTEKFLQLFSKNTNIPLTILRISTVYGPRDRSNQIIPLFIKKALLDETITLHGNASRDFIYISDLIELIMNAIKQNKNDLMNIGSGKKTSIQYIAKKIIEITGSKSKISYSTKPTGYDFVCDISRSVKNLEYSPKTSIEKGLDEEIVWYKKSVKFK